MSERARQFMPFAALRGYYDMINEKQRIKQDKRELSEEEEERLSRKINKLKKGMMVKVIYYRSDAYESVEGMLSRIDIDGRTISVVKNAIAFDDIYDISADELNEDGFDFA